MEIYVDKKFLDKFWAKYDPEVDTHRNLRRFLTKVTSGKVILDFDYKNKQEFDLAIAENPFLDELINVKSVTPNNSFKADCFNSDFYENGSASKYFFIEDLNFEKIEENFGCISINSLNLEKASFLFSLYLYPISKKNKTPKNWDFVNDLNHPFNSMIITDNYLFDINSKEMNENLIPFLKTILPKKLQISFHLTIIGKDTKKNGVDISKKKKEIENALSGIFSYEINITIIPEPVHDRNIFTNFLWINSGIGLSIFKVGDYNLSLKNNSNFTIFPISYISLDFKPYYTNIKSVNSITVLFTRNELIENTKKINQMQTASVGNKFNRLL